MIPQSILEILLLDPKGGISGKTGKPWSILEAHCLLKNMDGTVASVGILQVPKALEALATVGLFTCTFGMVAGQFGADQGRLISVLTGLVPILPSNLNRVRPPVAS